MPNTQDEIQGAAARAIFMENVTTEDLSLMSPRARGLIMTIRSLENLTGPNLLAELHDILTPEMVFHADIAPWPNIWSEMRKFLAQRQVNLIVHERRRAVYTLANSIFPDENETRIALEMAHNLLSTGQNRETRAPSDQQTHHHNADMTYGSYMKEKAAHNVAMRLKDYEQKFSGDLGQCWQDFVDNYEQISEDYNLNEEQKLQYLHNLMSKDAHRFYLEKVKPNAKTYVDAVIMIDKEYNSVVRQTRVKNHLSSLRLATYITSEVDTAAALAIVYKRILSMSRQVPPSHRGDAHKIEFLRAAVIGNDWATEPLSRIATNNLSFQSLYAELEIAVQLNRESKAAMARDNANDNSKTTSSPHIVNFSGQGKAYGQRYNKKFKKGSKTRACFNCNSTDHLVRDCPHPVNYTKAAVNRIKSLQDGKHRNAVHLVLAHLCSELDMESSEHDSDDPDGDDAEIFESMLVQTPSSEDKELDKVEILTVSTEGFERDVNNFWGACLDSGAQRTVIGEPQAKAYCKLTGIRHGVERKNKSTKFRFGNVDHKGLGEMDVRLPLGGDHFISITAHVVPLDIPLLLGLDVMQELKLVIDLSENTLYSPVNGKEVPLVSKRGHIYLEWPPSIFYTEAELRKIHRHFYHPSSEKLYALLKKAGGDEVDSDVKRTLEKVQRTCDTCQRHGSKPHRFRVAIPDEYCIFNRVVGMDLMKIDNRTVLHIVDRDTKFAASTFLRGESTAHVWEAFLMVWVASYVGYPDKVLLDQGSQFQSNEFASLLLAAGIDRKDAGVESHNSLGETERYHAYLRHIFEKARAEHPNLSTEVILQLATKACNDTAGPSGLVPTLLVFGVMPRLPIHPKELPSQKERMETLHQSRIEMAKVIARARLRTAMNKNVPASADSELNIGDMCLIYRESPISKWVGPYRVIDIDSKAVTVILNGRPSSYSIDKCRRYIVQQLEEEAPTVPDSIPAETMDINQSDDTAADIAAADETYWDLPYVDGHSDNPFDVFVVRLLTPSEPRAQEPDFDTAKRIEVDGLIKRKIWRIVNSDDIPNDANVVGGRFILSLKNVGTPDEAAKVRYIAQGYADAEKPFLVHDVSALRPTSIRFILSISSIMGLRLFLHDVSQAYLQSTEDMTRTVYLKPKAEDRKWFDVAENEALQLMKPLYGLCDSGDYWNVTIKRHITEDLSMTPCISDPSMYLKHENDSLIGMTGNYVDDELNSGTPKFEKLTEGTMRKFECKKREYDNFGFFGTRIHTVRKDEFLLNQEHYCKALRKLPLTARMEDLRRARALLAWTTHTRPDLACLVNKLAQVTEKTLKEEHIKALNVGIKSAISNPSRGLRYKPLDADTIHMRVYADASFGTNDDLTSQLGYLVLLCDKNNQCHVLDYGSKKSRRVVRSIMGGELYAFTDAFDISRTLSIDVSKAIGKPILLRMFTDSKQVFDVITRGKRPTERRLAIDVCAAREAYGNREIDRVGLVRGEDNPADALSKIGSRNGLLDIIEKGVDKTPVQEWIVRTDDRTHAIESAGSVEVKQD